MTIDKTQITEYIKDAGYKVRISNRVSPRGDGTEYWYVRAVQGSVIKSLGRLDEIDSLETLQRLLDKAFGKGA